MRTLCTVLALSLGLLGCSDDSGGPGGGDMSAPADMTMPAPSGHALCARNFGSAGYDRGLAVAFAANGDVIVAGIFEDTVDFGGGPFTSAGSNDVFLARFSGTCQHIWSRRLGGPGYDETNGITLDRDGNIFMIASFEKTADFGAGPITSAGGYDIGLIKLSGAGDTLWAHGYGGPGDEGGGSVGIDPAGDVLITGYYSDGADFGGGVLPPDQGHIDIFLAKYGSDGKHLWSNGWGGDSTDFAYRAVAAPNGDILMTGFYNDTIDFGGGPLVSFGEKDIFLARFSSAGKHIWSKHYGGATYDNGRGVALDSKGHIDLVGDYRLGVDFGGGLIPCPWPKGDFVAQLEGDGGHRWSHGYGGPDTDIFMFFAEVDAWDNLVVTGSANGTVDVGGPIDNGGAWVAKYSPGGQPLWAFRVGGLENEGAYMLAIGPGGRIALAGDFMGKADYGSGMVQAVGDYDAFFQIREP